MTDQSSTRRRWYQFGLRTLLIGVTVLGLVAWICAMLRTQWALRAGFSDYQAARQSYYEKWFGYNVGMTTSDDVCLASSALFDAEVRLGGGSLGFKNALQAHLERLKVLRDKISVPPDFATTADPQQLKMVDDAIARARGELKETGEVSN